MTVDTQTRNEIRFDINRIDEILRFDIFTPENHRHPLLLSALTEILIRLRLWKSDKFANPVSFKDDATIKGKVTDVTSLVVFVRDAVCHIDSANHDHDQVQARVSFNVIFGKGCLFEFGQASIESEYELIRVRKHVGANLCVRPRRADTEVCPYNNKNHCQTFSKRPLMKRRGERNRISEKIRVRSRSR